MQNNDYEYNFNLDRDIQEMFVKETYLTKIILPYETFIVESKSLPLFNDLKRFKCHIRLLNLVWNSNEYKISNLPNNSNIDYISDFIESYNKLFEDDDIRNTLMSISGAEKYIKKSSLYLDEYGNKI